MQEDVILKLVGAFGAAALTGGLLSRVIDRIRQMRERRLNLPYVVYHLDREEDDFTETHTRHETSTR